MPLKSDSYIQTVALRHELALNALQQNPEANLSILAEAEYKVIASSVKPPEGSLSTLAPWLVSDLTGADDFSTAVVASAWHPIVTYIRVLDRTLDNCQLNQIDKQNLIKASAYFAEATSYLCRLSGSLPNSPAVDFSSLRDSAFYQGLDMKLGETDRIERLLGSQESTINLDEVLKGKNQACFLIGDLLSTTVGMDRRPVREFLAYISLAAQIVDDFQDLHIDLKDKTFNHLLSRISQKGTGDSVNSAVDAFRSARIHEIDKDSVNSAVSAVESAREIVRELSDQVGQPESAKRLAEVDLYLKRVQISLVQAFELHCEDIQQIQPKKRKLSSHFSGVMLST